MADRPRASNPSRPAGAPGTGADAASDSLLQRIAGGDLSAVQECMDRYGGLMWSLARRLSVSADEAEDAVQEIFIALWQMAGRFDPAKGSEVTFVSMIARRRLIDRMRRSRRRQELVTELAEQPPRSLESQADAVAVHEEAHRARAAMEELSRDQKRVLTLAIHHGLTHDQIARHTGMPLGTVKTHARRGLIQIRDRLNAARSGGVET